jgi:predicted SnoaL-like aldol condensation-catalyzing enzyme
VRDDNRQTPGDDAEAISPELGQVPNIPDDKQSLSFWTHIPDNIRMRISILFVIANIIFAQTPPDATQLERNKQLLIDFFNYRGDPAARVARFFAENYIQHNPRFLEMNEVTHASGRDAWLKAQQAAQGHANLVANGGIPLRDPILVMAEGDLVTAVYKAVLPDPDDKSKTYEAFTFETFRVKDGKFTEHWDGVQLAPGWRTEVERGVQERDRKMIAVDPKLFDMYVGRYELASNSVLTITREGDHLFGQVTGQSQKSELFAEGEKEYFLKNFDVQITFEVGSAGVANQLVLRTGERNTTAKRIE